MKIFNLKFITKDPTPFDDIHELNAYTLGDAADVGIGKVYGIQFFVTSELERTFFLVQCEDEHLIYFVPEGDNIKFDDYVVIFSHNTYEDKYDIVDRYASFNEAVMLRGLWLYSINNHKRYNTSKCLGVN